MNKRRIKHSLKGLICTIPTGVLCLLAAAITIQQSYAVQGINGIQAAYDNQTSTNDNYSTTGGGDGSAFPTTTTYNISFNIGSQNNLEITGFDVGGNTYEYIQLSDKINIERIDNAEASGLKHIILYEKVSVGTPDIDIKASYVHTMEDSLRSENVNRGADNVFANTGDGNGNNNNIERIDYIFADGYPLHDNLHIRGFLVMDRGGNDRFKIAAITSLSNGVPTTFGTPVSVVEGNWGFSGINIETIVMRGYTESGDKQHPSADLTSQPLDGVFISWQEMGLVTNGVIYGYSLTGNDVPGGADWAQVSNPTYFPTNTSPGGQGGGLDLMSGGAMFFDDSLDARIGNLVWNDYDGDGIQDANEPGITNVLIKLYDSQTNWVAVVRTLSDGTYQLRGLAPGAYFAEYALPTNSPYTFTPQNIGTNDTIDSDAATNNGQTALITLSTGESNMTVDVGMHLPPSDLSVTKTVDEDNPNEGDIVTFTIVVTNKGNYTANEIKMTDLLPAGIAFSNAVPDQGTYTSSNGLWTIGTITNGCEASITISGSINPGTGGALLTNRATIIQMDRPDTNTTDNADSAVVEVQLVDLSVHKSVDDSMPEETDSIQYTVIVSNAGPDTATSVELTDLVPAGLTYSSSLASDGSYSSSNGVWTLASALAPSDTETLWLTVTVDGGTAGDNITNTAAVATVDQADHNSANDTNTAVITIAAADLEVIKTVDNPAPNEGMEITYTIVVTNHGPTLTTGVTIKEPLTNGISYVSSSASLGNYNPATKVWTVGVMPVGASEELTITVSVDPSTEGTLITNRSYITGSSMPDPDNSNNSDTAIIAVSGLTITKTSDVDIYTYPGSNITYTIAITNESSDAHTNVTVRDLVPSDTTYVSNSVSVTWFSTNISQNVRDVFGTRAYTNNNGSVNWKNAWQEEGEADGATSGGAQVTTGSEGQLSMNRALKRSVDLSTATDASLSFFYRELTSTTSNDVRDLFSVVSYANNDGNMNWTNDWQEGGEADGAGSGDLRISGGVLQIANDKYITRNVNIDEALSATLFVTYEAADGLEQNNVHDTFETVAFNNNDGSVSWAADWVEIGEGDGAGSGDIRFVNDGVSRRFRFRDNNNGGEGASRAVDLSGYTNATLSFLYRRFNGSGSSGTVTLSVTTNGWSSQTDLQIFTAGEDLSYISTNYDLTPYISANTEIRFLTSSDNGNTDGVYIDNVDITFSRPLMEPDDVAVIQVSSNGTDWTDLLMLSDSYSGPVSTNFDILAYASTNTTIRFAVTNYQGSGEAFRIDEVKVAYEAPNLEPDDHMFVEVSSNGTDWVQLMTRSDDFGGTYYTNFNIFAYASTNTTIRFRVSGYTNTEEYLFFDNIDITYKTVSNPGIEGDPEFLATNYTLLPGESMLITFDVTVNDSASQTAITNTASVTSDQQQIPVTDTVIDPIINTDLAVFKTLDNPGPEENNSIIYTVVVTNYGPENVTGVEITDVLPGDLTYITNSATKGSYVSVSGLWTIGALNVAESATLTISATINPGTAGNSITNTATITSLEQVDSNPANDQSSAEVVVVGVDVGVTKTVNEPIPYEEENIIYTIVVTNEGPSTATGISLTDQLPAGVNYVSHNTSDGSYTNTTGIWTDFSLAANSSATLTITANVETNTSGSSITNWITIDTVNETDNNPANEADSAVIDPITAPLTINKNSDAGAYAEPGDTVTYTIVVTNQSGSAKTGVNISDSLPTNTTYVASSSSVDGPYITNGIVFDDFLNKTYTNSYGTVPWSAAWVESEADGPNNGNLQLLFDNVQPITYTLRFAGGNASMGRAANLQGYTNAMLSFDYRRVSLEAGEYVAIEMSSNGTGGPWTELDRFQGAATDAAYNSTNYDISSYISASTALRFVTTSGTMAADDIVWFDDVMITAQKRVTNSIAGDTPPNIATNYSLLPGESLTATFQISIDTPYDNTQLLNTASVECDGFPPIEDTVIDTVVISRIGGFVWLDENTNGVQNGGEIGVSNITVKLYDGGSNLLYTTTSDSSGNYLFSGWTGGTYQVKFVTPSNYTFTVQDQGGDDNTDSDPDTGTGLTAPFVIATGTNDYSRDAGLVFPPANIGDKVWFDSDADGIQDGGETGIVNVTVELYTGSSNLVDTTTTDASGDYLFTNIVSGDYFVKFILPTNYTFSPQNSGINDAVDSDPDASNGQTAGFILAGSDQMSWDAGMFLPAIIEGTVWYDFNSNGVQNAGETNGISGVQVILYNASSNFVALTTTDANGNYTFDALLAGSYFLAFSIPANYVFSPKDQGGDDALDSDPDTGTGKTIIFPILAGVTDDTRDAGMYVPLGSIGNWVWYDTDANGIQDGGEPGVTNITVRLLNTSLDVLDTTTTDASGNYAFGNRTPGDYIIEVVLPGGYALGPNDVGADDSIDSDPNPGTKRTGSFYLSAGTSDNTRDAGIYITSEIGSFVWYDSNTNGIQDGGESGISNVTVKLYNSASNLLDTTTTDGSGAYSFDDLAPGDYFIEYVLPQYHVFSLPDQGGDDNLDSDADMTTGRTATFSLTDNTVDDSRDAAMYIPPSTIGNLVWYDTNIDGIKDGGETGVINVTVKLYDDGTNLLDTVVTDASGAYVFTNIFPGSYFVEFIAPSNYLFSPKDQGGDDTVDSDPDTTTGLTEIFVVGTDTNAASWDAGIYEPGIMGDYVWLDLNTNGYQDVSESSIPNVTVNLYDENTNYLATSTTDGAGAYAFTNLAAGNYLIEYILPTNYAFSPKNQGGDDTLDSDVNPGTGFSDLIALASGEINTTYDAGMTVPLSSIGDFVWFDANSNGLQDAESGMTNVTVKLYSGTTQLLDTVVTDASGAFSFTNLIFGEYFIEFVRPAGYAHSPVDQGSDTIDSDANQATGRSPIFYLSPGTNMTNLDAGFMIPIQALSITKTSDATGVLEPDDIITYTITVVNTGTVEQTGVTITDTLPPGLTYVSNSCEVVAPSTITNTFRDEFSTIAYTNNDGTLNWATDWTEIGEITDPTGQDYQILADVSNYQLRCRDDAKGIQRTVNLSGYDSATLSFIYRRESLDSSAEYIGIDVSSNGIAGPYDNLAQFQGAATDPSYLNANYDISSYISSDTAIRFWSDATGMANDDIVYIDDVKILVISTGINTNTGGAPPNLASGHKLHPGESMIVTFQATVDKPSVVTQVVNTATVVSDNSAPIEDSVEDPVAYADLGVLKDINTDKPGTNEVIWYTIVVTNLGPYRADEIELTDQWPSEVVFDSWAASQGTYDTENHIWSLGLLDVSNTAKLLLTGIVASVGGDVDIENFVEITFVDRADPDDFNNTNFSKATTLVVLSGFETYLQKGQVILEWTTEAEVNTAGFYLYRSEYGEEYVQVNSRMLSTIPGQASGGVYHYRDADAKPNREYNYKLVEVERRGRENVYGPFTVTAEKTPKPRDISWRNDSKHAFRIGEKISSTRNKRLEKRKEYIDETKDIYGQRLKSLRKQRK